MGFLKDKSLFVLMGILLVIFILLAVGLYSHYNAMNGSPKISEYDAIKIANEQCKGVQVNQSSAILFNMSINGTNVSAWNVAIFGYWNGTVDPGHIFKGSVIVDASTGEVIDTRLPQQSDNHTYIPSGEYLAYIQAPNLTQEDEDRALQIASGSDLYKEYIGYPHWNFTYMWAYPYNGNVYMSTGINEYSNNSTTGQLGFIIDIKNNSIVSSDFNDYKAIHFINGMVTGIPPQDLTIMGQLYDAGRPVTSLLDEGFIQTGIVQNHTYDIGGGAYWSNDEYPLAIPFGNNSYSLGHVFKSGDYKDAWFVEGRPFWFRFEKWDNITHTVVRYESNEQYLYNGQPINIDLATDMHIVAHPYTADASFLIGLPDNETKNLMYDFPGSDSQSIIPGLISPGQIYPDEFRDGAIQYNDHGVPIGTLFSIGYSQNPAIDNSTVRPIGPQQLSSVSGEEYMQEYQYNTIDGKTHTSYVGISGRSGPMRLNIDGIATEWI